MLEINKIYNADCLELMKEIPDKSIDLVLTDIPYNECNRNSNGLRNLNYDIADVFNLPMSNLLKELNRICKGSFYIFCGTEQISEIRKTFVNYGLSTRTIVWEKTNPSPMNGEFIWLSGIELAFYGKNKKATFNAHCKNTVLKHAVCQEYIIHPTQKPLSLFKEFVNISTNENDLVLDCFSGSGTTAIACSELKRNFICIEKDFDYWKASCERLENYNKQLKLF